MAVARQLFRTLLAEPWSAEHENEAFPPLEKLSDAEEPASRLAFAVAGLYRLTDRMVGARYQAAMRERGQAPFAGTARRVLRTNGACPLFPPRSELRRKQQENLVWPGRASATICRRKSGRPSKAAGPVDRHRAALPRRALGQLTRQGGRGVL